ncbi:uncharacterized protein EV420DRAFT_1612807 [Desarmillaria tabescens]|uniref:Uncharacterized protein n=1 Tax=Armillaria tabescens TaxID=1929756 RepID=A0AA39MEY3_ARMTA|nr:uncharacterized protein EV420DRAFT_1612807 [Desarmillaria tabescens]KAK0430985.1 hypothetical protein EV420DRAFT_1612807 [Desarmillaria tabescens]
MTLKKQANQEAIIRRMYFLRVTLYGLAWSLCEACVVAWLVSVAVRGQPAWCGCVAAWLRGCVVRKRGWLRGPRYTRT